MKNPITSIKKFITILALKVKRSSKWRKVRKAHIQKQWWCRYCGNLNNLEVHHIQPFHLYPELELDEDNLITLCEGMFKECHLKQGHLGNYKKYNPDIKKIATASPNIK